MTDLLAQFHELPAVSLAAFALVAMAGLLMGFAPRSLPLVSVVVGSVAGRGAANPEPATRQGLLFAAGFVLGIATVDAAIGRLFGFVGDAVIRALAGSQTGSDLLVPRHGL
jgi:cytochrome c-type biogenesis protein